MGDTQLIWFNIKVTQITMVSQKMVKNLNIEYHCVVIMTLSTAVHSLASYTSTPSSTPAASADCARAAHHHL